jgi:mannosyltransferase
MTDNIDLFVTNYNKNFTGVSATTANVLLKQAQTYNLRLVGCSLPECPKPVSRATAYYLAKAKPKNKLFSIWHVRRNNEMRDAIIARDILRLPIKIVFTSAAQRQHSLVPRWLISKMDTVIATTELAASYVPNVGAIIPHGVNTEKFRPSNNLRDAWKKTGYPGVKGIATIGRIRKEKGTDFFVDSMIRILPNMKDLTALIIGKAGDKDKSFLENLKSKVNTAGLNDRIIFTGEISAEKLPIIFRSLSLLVALPRYEGFGMTPLEGMASGVPFVASSTGYFKEFSDQGRCGKVVPVGDLNSAIECITLFLTEEEYRNEVSIRGRKAANETYSISNEVQLIGDVYKQLWSV